MALANYSNLKSAIQTWTHRDDIADLADDIIDLCETQIYNNEAAPLKVRELETSDTTSAGAATLALPTGFIEMRKLTLTSGSEEYDCRYRAPESLQVVNSSSRPKNFTIAASAIKFDRTPDQTYTANRVYLAKPTALSSSNTTNTVLTNYPNIYLFGCMWAAFIYTGEEQKAANAYNQFLGAIRGANKTYKRGQYGPAPAMRTETSTP